MSREGDKLDLRFEHGLTVSLAHPPLRMLSCLFVAMNTSCYVQRSCINMYILNPCLPYLQIVVE